MRDTRSLPHNATPCLDASRCHNVVRYRRDVCMAATRRGSTRGPWQTPRTAARCCDTAAYQSRRCRDTYVL